MRKFWIGLAVGIFLLTALVATVIGQQNHNIQAVARVDVDVPVITGTHVITVPVSILVPSGEESDIPLTLELTLNLNVTDTIDSPTTASPIVTVLPTNTPTPTPTNTPTPTPAISPRVNRNSNLRAGPGTNFAIVGSVQANQELDIIGVNEAEDWYKLANETWIAAFLVDDAPADLPVVAVEPTATPSPTATLKSTSVPTNAPTSEDAITLEEYSAILTEETTNISNALREFASLMQNPQVGSEIWTLNVGAQMAIIHLAHDQLSSITPPQGLSEVHSAILDATGDCDASMDLIAEGIDNFDVATLEKGSALMLSCTEKANTAVELMEAFGN